MSRITVVVVDDHKIVRRGIRDFVSTQDDLEVVGEAGSGSEAVEQVVLHAPDVVLMDLAMPEMDGVTATRKVKRESPRSQVIVLTSHHDDEYVFPAIRAGALSYLLKDTGPTQLVDAIRKAAQGEPVLDPQVAERLMDEVRAGDAADPFADLTRRELEVLERIAQGVSNREIAETLFIAEKTVKCHVSNILGKLHLADRTQAAVMAWREGVARPDSPCRATDSNPKQEDSQ